MHALNAMRSARSMPWRKGKIGVNVGLKKPAIPYFYHDSNKFQTAIAQQKEPSAPEAADKQKFFLGK